MNRFWSWLEKLLNRKRLKDKRSPQARMAKKNGNRSSRGSTKIQRTVRYRSANRAVFMVVYYWLVSALFAKHDWKYTGRRNGIFGSKYDENQTCYIQVGGDRRPARISKTSLTSTTFYVYQIDEDGNIKSGTLLNVANSDLGSLRIERELDLLTTNKGG